VLRRWSRSQHHAGRRSQIGSCRSNSNKRHSALGHRFNTATTTTVVARRWLSDCSARSTRIARQPASAQALQGTISSAGSLQRTSTPTLPGRNTVFSRRSTSVPFRNNVTATRQRQSGPRSASLAVWQFFRRKLTSGDIRRHGIIAPKRRTIAGMTRARHAQARSTSKTKICTTG
jgi:hypothetical protein